MKDTNIGPYLRTILILLLMLIFGGEFVKAGQPGDTTQQDTLREESVNVYVDCWFCDTDHIKRQIDYVNYVRDRKDADVHIMVTTQRAANGGRRYSVFMMGQNGYSQFQDTLRFNVGPNASDEERRQQVLHAFKSGLTPYLLKTPVWKNLEVDYSKPEEAEEVADKWNYWVFEVSANGRMNGEESTRIYNFGGSLSADKITEDLKLEFNAGGNYNKTIYEVNSKTITSIHRNYNFRGLGVISLSQHWSAGGYANMLSSRYMNLKFATSISPAIEFNIFPYSEATTRQFSFLYRPEFVYAAYEDTTIFNRIREQRFRERLSVDFRLKKEWGTANFSLDASHYFHDFSKNRLSLNASISLNLVKGLNVHFSGGASLIHDQLFLPKGDATTEEILTRQQQLATNYSYYTRFGISYTFGSTYNNIVNPRF